MKKFLVLSCLLGLWSMVCARGISLGLKGGLTMPKLSGGDAGSTQHNNGLVAGGYVSAGLLPGLSLQPEVLFVQKGWREGGMYLGQQQEVKYRVNYVEFPLLAKYSLGGLARPYFLAGPFFAARLGTHYEETLGDSVFAGNVDGFLKTTDYGLTLGAGINFPVKFSLEARYDWGLSKISSAAVSGQPDLKNSTISIVLGYAIF